MQGSLRKRNDKWYYSFELTSTGGKRRRIERAGGRTKKEAEQAMRKAMAEFETTGRVFEPSEISFTDYMEYWLKEYVELNLKPNTYTTYAMLFKSRLKPFFKDYRLRSISAPLLQNYFNDLFRAGVPQNTFRLIYSMLSGALKYAHTPCGYIPDSPIRSVVKPKYRERKDEIRVIPSDHLKKIFSHLNGSELQLPFLIAYYTGFRATECLGLTWDNVDFKAGTLTVDKILQTRHGLSLGTPKTTSSYRTVPVSPKLLALLRQHSIKQKRQRLRYGDHYANYYRTEAGISTEGKGEPLGFICTLENGEFITYARLQSAINGIRRNLKLGYTFHDLRHTHATMLLEGGANPKDVQERLGHASFSTTMDTYAHATKNMKKQTIEIFDRTSADIL